MKRKIAWLGVSWLIVATLVLASCGPTVPEGEEEEEEEEEIPTLSIGETFQSPEMEVTVSEVVIADSYEYYNSTLKTTVSKEANPGESFLIATVAMENVSNATRDRENKKRFRVSDSEGSEYTTIQHLGEDCLPDPYFLTAGQKIEGKVLFPITKGASGLKIVYLSVHIQTPKKLAEWVIE